MALVLRGLVFHRCFLIGPLRFELLQLRAKLLLTLITSLLLNLFSVRLKVSALCVQCS
jgi:hypothetical protein